MTTNEDFDMADAHADRELEAADRARRAEWDERERVEMHNEAARIAYWREHGYPAYPEIGLCIRTLGCDRGTHMGLCHFPEGF